jgi:L-asparaginase II
VRDASTAGELAVVVRNGVIESRHVGHGALVDPDGRVVASVGDPTTTIYPRSSLKPWQAASVRRHGAMFDGASLDGQALAIACGSHLATARHRDLVTRMLADASLDGDALGCPPALPPGDEDRAAALIAGEVPSRVAYNCSGKHASMLLACVANGWPVADYLDPEHPVQVAIRTDLEAALGQAVVFTGVDGCGAPAFVLELAALARAGSRLARGDQHDQAVVAAIRAHPWAVRGPGQGDTLVMEHLDGVIAKAGAEGVQLLATADGWAVVVKALDGAGRAAMIGALALLGHAVDVSSAEDAVREPVLGGGVPVGAVVPGAGVQSG